MATVEELPEEVLEQILRQPGLSCRDLVAAGLTTVLYCTVLYCTVLYCTAAGLTCHRWLAICDQILRKRRAVRVAEAWSQQCWNDAYYFMSSL